MWQIGPRALEAQFRALSWRLPVLLLPYALVAVLDAAGWRYAFPGRLPPLALLVAARLAGEAVNTATPTATLGGEPVKAWLLTRARVPFDEGLVSVVIAKTALVAGQLGFLALGLALAAWAAPAASALLAAMLALTGIGIVAIGGFVVAQLRGLFGASERVLGWIGLGEAVAGRLGHLDVQVRAYYAGRRGRLGLSVLCHFLGWAAGGLEVWLALRLLGVPVGVGTALAIEAFAGAISSAAFLIPASLGAQEGGLVAIFLAFGLGASTGLAVGLIRRAREAVWTVVGFALLVAWPGAGPPAAAPKG